MNVEVLGPLRIIVGSATIGLTGRHTAAALAYLTLHSGRAVPLADLASAIGGASSPPPLRSLRADLRRVAGTLPPEVLAVSAAVRLTPPPGAVDADRFTALVRQARRAWASGDRDISMTTSSAALALWRGDPYPELADLLDALPTLQHLRSLHLDAREIHQEFAIAAGVDWGTVAEARRLAAAHPERRALRLQFARALHLAGRQVEALAELREIAAVLGDSPLTRHTTTLVARRDPAVRATASIELTPGATPAPAPRSAEMMRTVG